jgi:hypothetical protein
MDYTKINANDQLDLKGSCLAGCYGDGITFIFNIYKLDTQTNQFFLFEDRKYVYQYNYIYSFLTILSDFFSLNPNQNIYKVEYSVFIESRNVSGSSSLILYVNFPPKYGKCDINPKTGTALITQFIIVCSNFRDQNGFIASYFFYCKRVNTH